MATIASTLACPISRSLAAEWPGIAKLPPPAREAPFSSPLSEEARPGTYHCSQCGRGLFASSAKYFTSTGWPSFRAHTVGALRLGSPQEGTGGAPVHCSTCDRHLGDLLHDGPGIDRRRYSINGSALTFAPLA